MSTAGTKWNMTSEQAHNYIVQPLLAPDPSDETGLNASHNTIVQKHNLPTPPSSASPASDASMSPDPLQQQPTKPRARGPSNPPPYSPQATTATRTTRSRGNSLTQRFPGDMTHRPLDMLKKDAKAAHKTHRRQRSSVDVDTIDSLDAVPGGQYHHEGPFDATLLSRNAHPAFSPVAAVAESNRAALQATPRENIANAVEGHWPLDGVASVPPGQADPFGRTYDYVETNLMDEEGGNYKKFPGEEFNIDQIKRREREEAAAMRTQTDAAGRGTGIELTEQHLSKKEVEIQEGEIDAENSGRSKRHSLQGLKNRIGSLRRKRD